MECITSVSQHLMVKVGSLLDTDLYCLFKKLNVAGLHDRLGGGFKYFFYVHPENCGNDPI